MTDSATPDSALEESVTALYSGPLEEFIRRRDALAKQYRAAGDRAAADELRALRKPSRLAWSLNAAMIHNPAALKTLDDAVAGAVESHGSSGDARAAMADLRAAVRELAGAAAETAGRGGHRVEASALTTAILAVLGSSASYARLRRGHLVDIPEGGGLDALVSLPSAVAVSAPAPRVESERQQQPDRVSLRADLARAAEQLDRARSRSDAAAQVVHNARSELAAAEQRLREAERELDAASRRHENARREAAAAAAELQDAEAAHQDAQRKLMS